MMKKPFVILVLFLLGISAFAGTIDYRLTVEKPHRNYYRVQIAVDAGNENQLEFKMPAWTPGSYTIENWAKNVISVQASDQNGKSLRVEKADKQTWVVSNTSGKQIKFSYQVYAWSKGNPYYAHLENNFAYYNGALIFMYVKGRKNDTCRLTYRLPESWKFHTSLQTKVNETTFSAPDYDTFIDCPAFLGNINSFSFDVDGKKHYVVMNAGYPYREQQISQDLKTMVLWFKNMMGDLPYDNYTFFLRIENPGRGGIEHLYSNVSCVRPEAVNSDRDNSDYFGSLLMLEAHEYFHLWNVKRIRPGVLGPFNYEHEVYTKLLWVSEGFTSYYTHRPLSAAGIIKPEEVYTRWASYYSGLLNNSALNVKPVSQYSFDAWLESEIPDYSFRVYYAKGAIIALLLDVDIREKTDHQKSMDGFFRYLYDTIYKTGKTLDLPGFLHALNTYSGLDFTEFFDNYVVGIKPLPFADYLERTGLRLIENEKEPFLGLKVDLEKKPYIEVNYIYPDSPADMLQICRGDEIVSVDERVVNGSNWKSVLSRLELNKSHRIQWFHNDRLHSGSFTVDTEKTTKFGIEEIDGKSMFIKKWLMPE